MSYLKKYTIEYLGLSLDNHIFEFEINEKFFSHFENSQIQRCNIQLQLEVAKKERMMILDFNFKGEIEVTCDRCSDEFMFPIETTEQLIVKFGSEHNEESEDVIVLADTEYQFNLTEYIYDFIHLALPIKVVHPDDEDGNSGCNAEVLKILNSVAITQEEDPRWETLKKLKGNL